MGKKSSTDSCEYNNSLYGSRYEWKNKVWIVDKNRFKFFYGKKNIGMRYVSGMFTRIRVRSLQLGHDYINLVVMHRTNCHWISTNIFASVNSCRNLNYEYCWSCFGRGLFTLSSRWKLLFKTRYWKSLI